MATIGLRDLYYAKITSEESAEAETYDKPERMAKAISAELSVEVAEAILYADDGADQIAKEFISGELTLNVNDLTSEVLADLLGQQTDGDNVIYAAEKDSAPYVAVGFRAKKANGQYKYLWLYKVKFGVPSESYQTKGESIEFTTPEITGKFVKRNKDGNWKSEFVGTEDSPTATAWFTTVREKKMEMSMASAAATAKKSSL